MKQKTKRVRRDELVKKVVDRMGTVLEFKDESMALAFKMGDISSMIIMEPKEIKGKSDAMRFKESLKCHMSGLLPKGFKKDVAENANQIILEGLDGE